MVSLVSVNDRSTAFSYVSGGERKDTLCGHLIILRIWCLIPGGCVEGNIYQATYLNKWNHFPTSPRNAFTRASSVPMSVHKPWWKKTVRCGDHLRKVMAKLVGKYTPKAPGTEYLPTFTIDLRQMCVNIPVPWRVLGIMHGSYGNLIHV